MPRRKRKTPYKPPVMNGDHGTGTQAAMAGKAIEPVLTDDGKNPNSMYQARETIIIREMHTAHQLTQRQFQAAEAIQLAHCRVEALSSGGPIKERVQASPKPDENIDVQVDAMSRRKWLMDPVPGNMRYVIEHVVWHNKPLHRLGPEHVHRAVLWKALDAVADCRRV